MPKKIIKKPSKKRVTGQDWRQPGGAAVLSYSFNTT